MKLIKNALRNPTPYLSRVIFLFFCAGVVGGLGCATTATVDGILDKQRVKKSKRTFTDTVIAIGQPNEKVTAIVGDDAIAFIGEKKTYLLTKGGKKLNDLARNLDPDRLKVTSDYEFLNMKDDAIWGDVIARYTVDPDGLAMEEEIAQLKRLGFTDQGYGYSLWMPVKGQVLPPLKIPPGQINPLSSKRKISFYLVPPGLKIPNPTPLITIPLAITVDAALSPLYLGLALVDFSIY